MEYYHSTTAMRWLLCFDAGCICSYKWVEKFRCRLSLPMSLAAMAVEIIVSAVHDQEWLNRSSLVHDSGRASIMRIALLADIHGNLAALEAVLVELERLQPDYVVLDGDLINGAPFSTEVIDLVRTQDWVVVRGNHEF